VNVFQFFVIRTQDPGWILIDIQPLMLDPDPYLYQMNADPKNGKGMGG
jgi:hypothetical protein